MASKAPGQIKPTFAKQTKFNSFMTEIATI